MFRYSPYYGCRKCSPSCDYCLAYRKHHCNTLITKSDSFDLLTRKNNDGTYVIRGNQHIEVSPYTDIFLDEVLVYLNELLDIFKERQDLYFHIKTKILSRVIDLLPTNMNDLYPNVSITVLVSNHYEFKREVDALKKLNLSDKRVSIIIMYDKIDILEVLDKDYGIKEISLHGADFTLVPLNYNDIVQMSMDTKKIHIPFNFSSTGKCIIKDNKKYYINYSKRISQAFKSGLSHD